MDSVPVHALARQPVEFTHTALNITSKAGDWLGTEQDVRIKRRGSLQESNNDLALRPLSRNRSKSQDGTEEVEGAGREQGALTNDEEPSVEYLDGGFGWAIVASTFVITFHFLGFLYSWGVIQADLLGKGLASSQLLSVVGGLQAFWNAAGCIPAAWLIQKIGVRKTTLSGVVLNSLAVLLASFSTESLGGLIFLQGIIAGIACGTLFMAVYPLPAQWFMRKRGIATGITSCGGGIGGAAWSLIIQKLIDKFGLPWAYRFMGALFGAIYNVASGIGRLGFGILADFVVGNLTSWIIALFAIAISSLCVWPFASGRGVIAVFTVLAGMGSGGYFSLQSSIVAQIVGSHRVNQAIGAIELASSIGFLAGPISGGALLDAFGGPSAGAEAYKPAMYLVGGTTFVSVILAVWIRASYSRKLFIKA
ncbi:hypothetical protein QFC22_000030 [Naganishia vaughanmartiniae]|uniref:Uncharacterized protein n=1 Tax=Naganishia vaughanmartiniae TaxID=1424756 RepID=A0ACC2XM75_9TREE|nr:hypothetical protein QFC22_000030 [Naganishia vaughanmartiniae]